MKIPGNHKEYSSFGVQLEVPSLKNIVPFIVVDVPFTAMSKVNLGEKKTLFPLNVCMYAYAWERKKCR